jgi:subtilisin family serine protease
MAVTKVLYLLLFLKSFSLLAQQDYFFLVAFCDKKHSMYSVEKPEMFLSAKAIQRRVNQSLPISIQDLPVSAAYLDSCLTKGAQILYSLKWQNSVVLKTDSTKLFAIMKFPFVKHARLIQNSFGGILSSNSVNSMSYGNSFNQNSMLGIDKMHDDGYNGNGIHIAIFDAGFRNADNLDVFQKHFQEGRVLSTWDFVHNESNVYDDDAHGTHCWSICGGYKPGSLIGPAYQASYHLLETEDASQESQLEELNWAKAAEYADSAGVDIISSSLGYSTFDNSAENYAYSDLDGDKTIITQAADDAASKGILVVSSAGNEGNTSWYYILAPADGDSVLAVGAVNSSKLYASFSSKGPSFDGRVKPNVSAQGQSTVHYEYTNQLSAGNGTSYSCPLVAGMAAGIWQANKSLTNMELLHTLEKSSSQYDAPDDFIGYGIPSYYKLKSMIGDVDQFSIFPNPGIDDFQLSLPFEISKEPISLGIYDLLGRKVWSYTFVATSPLMELPTLVLMPGLYQVILETESVKQDQKLIILR